MLFQKRIYDFFKKGLHIDLISETVIDCVPIIWKSSLVIKNVGAPDVISVRLPPHWVVSDVDSSKLQSNTGLTGPFVVVGPVIVLDVVVVLQLIVVEVEVVLVVDGDVLSSDVVLSVLGCSVVFGLAIVVVSLEIKAIDDVDGSVIVVVDLAVISLVSLVGEAFLIEISSM